MTILTHPILNQPPAPTQPIRKAPKITKKTHDTGTLLIDFANGKFGEEKKAPSNPGSSTPSLAFSAESLTGMYTEEEIRRFEDIVKTFENMYTKEEARRLGDIYLRDLANIKQIKERPPSPANIPFASTSPANSPLTSTPPASIPPASIPFARTSPPNSCTLL